MEWNQLFFNESITRNKVQGYREEKQDEASWAGDHASETYAEMVDEVEKVSEMLKQTQSKLWESQDVVKTYDSKAKILESTLEQKDSELQRVQQLYEELCDEEEELRQEIERLNQKLFDRDEARARPELEQRLRKAVEFVKKDLSVATEKLKNTQEQFASQLKIVADLKQANKTLEEKCQQLPTCQKQLREATEGNANLLEEVAKLREELNRTKKIAEQKDILIRREVEGNVKEKIKLEVGMTVTRQVTERVTRELTAKLKAERETELKALREQIKKIVKENAVMKSKIDGAEKMASETHALQQDVHALTYELTRYDSMIDEAKQEHEMRLAQLETDYRMKIQSVKDEAAKEKWEHASEIRKQMTLEREREVQNFTRRIEALSKQTDRLLERAEKEKEAYGELVRKQASREMQTEIKTLTEKLDARTKESDQLLRDAKKDKEAYADQVRRAIEEEKRREISKYSYRIEVLVGEKDSLEKRIESFEEEMAQVWEENETQVEQLKRFQADIKRVEDENFKLHRKCQNLSTLANRYKHDADEAKRDLKDSKQLFRETLLKSEEMNLKLKSKLKESDPTLNMSRERYADTLEALENAKKSLIDRMKLYEEENNKLGEQNTKLRKALDEKNKRELNQSESHGFCYAVEAANASLHEKIESLESLLGDIKKEGLTTLKTDVLLAMEAENVQLKSSIEDTSALLQKYRKGFHQSQTSATSRDIDRLTDLLESTLQLLDRCRDYRTKAVGELERVKRISEEAWTVDSEDDTTHSILDIETVERMLGVFMKNENESIGSLENEVNEPTEFHRLKAEVEAVKSMLETSDHNLSSSDDTNINKESRNEMEPALRNYYYESLRSELAEVQVEKSKLEDRVQDLNYILEKYRNELSRASKDLENTRQTLVLEGETAQQLNRRVESLNLLLDTTEQNHAENSRELAQSHRRFEEVANNSKREIERLNEEAKNLRESLTLASQQSQHDKRDYQNKLDAANAEINRWRSKVHALESELRRHQQEFDRSKTMYNDALDRSEQEIVRLKSQVEIVAGANLNYVEETKTLKDIKSDLEKALNMERRESKAQARKMNDLLRKAKDESKVLLKKMEKSESDFLKALQKGEAERIELKRSLDDVKNTLFGKSSDESSDHSSRKFNEDTEEGVADLQNELLTLSNTCSEEIDDDSSANVLPSFEDIVSTKKKRVSWKVSDWDIDAATVATNASHHSGLGAGAHTSVIPDSEYIAPNQSHNKSMDTSDSRQMGNLTSWDDLTNTSNTSMKLESNLDSTSQSADANNDKSMLEVEISDRQRSPGPGFRSQRKAKKMVSWDVQGNLKGEDHVAPTAESRDQLKEGRAKESTVESREPVTDGKQHSTNDKRNDIREDPFDFHQGEPDEESTSTIEWDIHQSGDALDTFSASEVASEDGGTTGDQSSFSESVGRTFKLAPLSNSSVSSSFSYSSTGSSSESEGASQEPENASILAVAQGEPPVSLGGTLLDNAVPLSIPSRRENKSRLQRAREKSAKRRGSKEEVSQFFGDMQRTGHHGRRLPTAPQKPDDLPFDERGKKVPRQDDDGSLDLGESEGSVAHTIDTALSNE